MNDIQENQLSMFQKTQEYLVNHDGDTSSVAMVATLRGQLGNHINSILDKATESGADITGYTADKQQKREALVLKIQLAAGAVAAWASVNNDVSTLEQVDETPSSINKMRDNDLIVYGQIVSGLADTNIAALGDFGLVAGDVTALNNAITNYTNHVQQPRVQIAERGKALIELATLFDETNSLLKTKLDNVMRVFYTTNPGLYAGYQLVRGIDDTGSASTPDYEGTAPASTITLIDTLNYLDSRTFKFKNTGSVELAFAFSTIQDSQDGTPVTVAPGAEAQRSTPNLNSSTSAQYLTVKNGDGSDGSYRVFIIE